MRWTDEKPTDIGWYWYSDDPEEAVVVNITNLGGGLFVEHYGWLSEMPEGWWQGPIGPSNEPEAL